MNLGLRNFDLITFRFVKWVFFPLIFFVIIFICVRIQINQWECEKMAKNNGYVEASYIPSYKGKGKACICSTKINIDGTIDTDAKLIIDLNH